MCDEWDARIDVRVSRIKAFFSMSKKVMEDAIASCILEFELMKQAESYIMNEHQEAELLGLENVYMDEE